MGNSLIVVREFPPAVLDALHVRNQDQGHKLRWCISIDYESLEGD